MANRLRLRSGQVQLVRARVRSEDAIDAGDLVYFDDNVARPASTFTPRASAEETQAAFAAVFLGIAHQPSAPGEEHDISVDISPMAVYEVDCRPAAYEVGDDLSLDVDERGQLRQLLRRTDEGRCGVARAVEYRSSSATTLRVCVHSAFGPLGRRRGG